MISYRGIFSYLPLPVDGVYQIEQPLVSRLTGGGWVCYWIEHRGDHPLSIMSQAFSPDGKPDGLRHRTRITCGDDLAFGVYPILPYGDGRLLVLPMGNTPSCAYSVGPEGDSLKHPDLAVSLNTSRPMTRGKPGTNAFIALAGRHPNASTEIELLDSAMTVVRRRTFPGGPGQELALTRTASGRVALLNLQAPYQSTSPFAFLPMDPRWE